MKIQISVRRIAIKRRRNYNRYRYIPIWSGELPQFKNPSMRNFARWLSDVFGPGFYLVLGHRKYNGRYYNLFQGSVNGYDYEIKRGSIKREIRKQAQSQREIEKQRL